MKQNLFTVLVIACCLSFISCQNATPEKYFDVAVLNSNMHFGFADDGLLRQLEQPSVKLDVNTQQTVPMKRQEVLDQKIEFTEDVIKKLKDLKETPETKDILQPSLALNEFVLKVYKNDYTKLAGLYDASAPKEQIEKLGQAIHDQYFAQYESLYNELISSGKLYADKHSIKVKWGVYGK